jgi:uncharacterized membrane protein
VLTTGLAVSAGLLLFGLADAHAGALRLGILILMATPVARVIVLTIGLLRERDLLFGLLSLGILGVLGLSMFLGAHL